MLLDKFTKKLGCSHFVCLSHVNPLEPPPNAVVLTNYPLEWALHHSAKNYHRYDPIMATCKSKFLPFSWSDDGWRFMLNNKQMKMMGEASEFGLSNGYTIPIHASSGYPGSLSIVYEVGCVTPEALAALQLLAYYVYEKAITMKTTSPSAECSRLTEKQRYVLEEISRGKSSWAISKSMGISTDGVNKHVKKIFSKYGVATRQQAIVRGLFTGEINYCDVITQSTAKDNSQAGFVHIQS